MQNKNIKIILNDIIDKLDKTENLGDKVIAGRIVPTPSFSIKPKIILKPKDKK